MRAKKGTRQDGGGAIYTETLRFHRQTRIYTPHGEIQSSADVRISYKWTRARVCV